MLLPLSSLLLVLLLVVPAQARDTTKVVGGDSVEDALQFPYFAQLSDTSCAAVLIHDDFLLTAAHCERRNHPFYKRVHFASTQINEGLLRTIQYTRSHPAYLQTLQDYDFSLLKLDSSALVDENGNPTGIEVLPINRDNNYPQPGDPLQAMGFGKTTEQANGMNSIFQEVEIDYISDDTCLQQYGPSQFYDKVMFCAGVEGGGKDTCQGDSGGPIVDIQRQNLVGIVSYGIGCARDGYAGVNARVSAVAHWIDTTICQHSNYPGPNCPPSTSQVPSLAVKANETGGAFTLIAQLDDYPEEFGWSLTYLGPATSSPTNNVNQVVQSTDNNHLYLHNQNEIFVLLPDTLDEAEAEIEQSFDDLPPGLYDLQFGDNGSDGLCCAYGDGFLRLINDLTGETVWEHDGDYRGYLLVRIQIDGTAGDITVVDQSEVYQPSWEQFVATNHPPDFDPTWPGPVPQEPRNSFTVNFKFDAYPYESDYELLYTSAALMEGWQSLPELSDSEWETVAEMDGYNDGVHNSMISNSYDGQPEGWYLLRVTDFGKDGICCSYRRGWISIMAPIITTTNTGLAWASDGEFGAGVDVYFYINADGLVAYVFWLFDTTTTTATERRRYGGGPPKKEESP